MKFRKKIIKILLCLSLVTILFSTNIFAEENKNLISTENDLITSQENSSVNQDISSNTDNNNQTKKQFYDTNEEKPDFTVFCNNAILVDTKTGKILYNKNIKDKKYPASTTKILTAILVLENCNLDDKVVVDYESIAIVPSGYTVAALQVGEELTVKQLLQMLLVPSANDAANVLAKHVAGSIDSFASMMNTKANEIGCEDSHFTNPSGVHDKDHYSTVYDFALLMDYCIKNPTFVELASLKSCIIPATNKYDQRVFTNTNEMHNIDTRDIPSNYYYPYLLCGKTGYTSQANNCLVTAAEKDGLKLICVVFDGLRTDEDLSAKFCDTKNLYEFGYNTYSVVKLREKDAIAKQIEISNATKDTRNLDLLINEDINVLTKQQSNINQVEPEFILNENIEAPIAKGDRLGTIIYNIEGIKYEAPLIAAHKVDKDNFWFFIFQMIIIGIIIYLIYKLLKSKKAKNTKNIRKVLYKS
ncbi:MAG: D-alanyl-D-alanine carboxypeptidase [Clostridia bacterium]|nr:D-alanyl-D-alanine carboxypeptidase [Clostridia bacterium]